MDGGDLTDFLNWTALEPLFCTSQEPEGGDADLTDTLGLQCGGAWLQKSGLSSLMGTSEYLGGPSPVATSPYPEPARPVAADLRLRRCFPPRLARERASRKAVVLGLDETGFAEAEGGAQRRTRLRAIADRSSSLDGVVVALLLRGDGRTEAKQGAATFNDEDAAGLVRQGRRPRGPRVRPRPGRPPVPPRRRAPAARDASSSASASAAASPSSRPASTGAPASRGPRDPRRLPVPRQPPVDAAREVRCPAMLLPRRHPDETKRGGAVHRASTRRPSPPPATSTTT